MRPREISSWVLIALVVIGSLGCARATGRSTASVQPVVGAGKVAGSTAIVQTTGSAATPRAGPRLDVNQGAPPGAAFTITLTGDGVTPADLLAVDDLGDVTLAAEPLLTADDLLTYDVTTHVFTLTMEAAGRVAALDVPTNGRGFVVAVEGTPVYAGAFWAPYSSLSYDGVVILILPGYSAGAGFPSESGTFRLDLGYPGSGFFRGSDPRSDPRVVDALVELGIAR